MSEVKIKRKPFFYDSQVKRYLTQIAGTAFAGWQVKTGIQRDGHFRYIDVPVMLGTYDRVVSYINGRGNMNVVIKLPLISMDITGLRQLPENRRNPFHVERATYRERMPHPQSEGDMSREVGDTSESYSTKIIERHMGVPYELKLRLTIWASNMDQSLQISEQIGTYFNDNLDIQLSNSPLDWTYLTTLKFEGNIDFSKQGKDIGAGQGEDDYHLVTMDFSTILHLSPPAKVFNADNIEEIHVEIEDGGDDVDDWQMYEFIDGFIIKADSD